MSKAPIISKINATDFVTRGPNLHESDMIQSVSLKSTHALCLYLPVEYKTEHQVGPHAAGDRHRKCILESIVLCCTDCHETRDRKQLPSVANGSLPSIDCSTYLSPLFYKTHGISAPSPALAPVTSCTSAPTQCANVTTTPQAMHTDGGRASSLPAKDNPCTQKTLKDSKRHIVITVHATASCSRHGHGKIAARHTFDHQQIEISLVLIFYHQLVLTTVRHADST